jgi:hypothetical protein
MIMADDSLFCTVSIPSLQFVQLFPLSNKSHSNNNSNIKSLSSIFCKVPQMFCPHQGVYIKYQNTGFWGGGGFPTIIIIFYLFIVTVK